MMPYEKTQKDCSFGSFDLEKKAGYILKNGDKLKGPWYYVYCNRKILLYVDQNGPIKAQYQPPNGILPIKREMGETQSKWQVWITSKNLNNGVPVSNFNSPVLRHDLIKPKFTVKWYPEKAIYTAEYDTAEIVTEIFVPSDKATVCMKTKIINKSDKKMDFCVTPTIFPYMNIPQMVAWDLPQWYLSTKVIHKDNMLTFHGQMTSPEQDKNLNRSITFNIDYDDSASIMLDMANFCGNGSFFAPNAVINNEDFPIKMSMADGESFGWCQSVYAAKYEFSLNPSESKTLTQVLTVQDDLSYNEKENLYDKKYFNDTLYTQHVKKTMEFYDELFSHRSIKTNNELYNNFINNFAPLEMYWVSSLDRGWPSSMRGIRDASQDYIGMLHLDSTSVRKLIIEMFFHQQKDGWMPRQISTVSRTAPHDMRYYCDGGAFLLELIHEYMVFTRDCGILSEKVMWLDSDEESTVLEHIKACVQFYLDDKNIGEHGLCKVWYGDWWDTMDKIGMDGIGETVTVTAQMVLNLKNLADMYKWLYKQGCADESYLITADKYMKARKNFMESMKKYAYNPEGYFNGYYNDNKKWLLCDIDPDGEKRVYLVSNAWAIISECADKEMSKSILNVIEKECFGRMGYNTKSKGYPVFIDKAGRVGDGTSAGTAPYNHAQSFFVRACCECGDAETAYKATRYILPIEEEYAPVEQTYAPPFAIANAYGNDDKFLHRVEFQYLSGTVSYVLRTVYNFFFGITFTYDGLILKPCIPKEFGDCSVKFSYLGKNFEIEFKQTKNNSHTVTLNSKLWKTSINERSEKLMAEFSDSDFESKNHIIFEY